MRWAEAGVGPAVVLVHGLGLAGDVWAACACTLAEAGYRAVAPDLPGFGGSPGPIRGLDGPGLARWLLGFADAAGAGRPAWVGHSLSDRAVMRLAGDQPARARAVALVSPAYVPGRLPRVRELARLTLDAFREPPRVLLDVARAYVRASPSAFFGTWLRAERDPVPLARRVRCPTLLVVGSRDPLSPPPALTRLRDALPRGSLECIRGTSHGLALDASGELGRVLVRFLEGEAGGRR